MMMIIIIMIIIIIIVREKEKKKKERESEYSIVLFFYNLDAYIFSFSLHPSLPSFIRSSMPSGDTEEEGPGLPLPSLPFPSPPFPSRPRGAARGEGRG